MLEVQLSFAVIKAIVKCDRVADSSVSFIEPAVDLG